VVDATVKDGRLTVEVVFVLKLSLEPAVGVLPSSRPLTARIVVITG
jgi:hypothetical protein